MDKNNIIKIIVGIAILVIVILLLRNCSPTKYLVTFDSNGGTPVENVTVKKNDTVAEPTSPTKKGYIFKGWYYGKKLFNFDTKIKKNITLKAKWKSDGTGIILKKTKLEMYVGDQINLEIKSLLKGLKKKNLIWESSDESIVKVDANGKLTALKPGTVIITVKTKDGKRKTTAIVTVYDKEQIITKEGTTKNSGSNSVKKNTQKSEQTNSTITKYIVTITADVQKVTNVVSRYYFKVSEDGKTITNYQAFVYNGRPVKPNSGTIAVDEINKNINSVQLKLEDGTIVIASVIYK